MKLLTTIQRPNGSTITMENPKTRYHFKPTAEDARHIADVNIADHVIRLLRHDHFQQVDPAEELPAGVDLNQPEDDGDIMLIGSNIHNATYVIKGETITLGELVMMACEESGLSPKEWNNDLADQERYAFIDQVLAELNSGTFESAATQNALITAELAQNAGDTVINVTAPAPAAPVTPAVEITPEPAPAAPTAPAVAAELDRDALAAEYKALFNRMPNGKMTAANIKAVLDKEKE